MGFDLTAAYIDEGLAYSIGDAQRSTVRQQVDASATAAGVPCLHARLEDVFAMSATAEDADGSPGDSISCRDSRAQLATLLQVRSHTFMCCMCLLSSSHIQLGMTQSQIM